MLALLVLLVAVATGPAVALRARYVASFFAHRWRRFRDPRDADEIPALAPTLSVALKMALDETALASVALWAGLPTIEERRRTNDEVTLAHEFFRARGWLDDPRGYHDDPPPLASPRIRSRSRLGLAYEQLSFESGYEPHAGEPGRERWLGYAANRTAHAWAMRHPGPPRPWLVCIHAFQMGTPLLTLNAFHAARLHGELGLNLLFPVLPLHGPRKIGWRNGDGLLAADPVNTVHGMAQTIFELRRMLGWVRAEGAPAVGVYGLSLGGYTTALLAAFDAGLACAVAGVPAADFVDLEEWHSPSIASALAIEAGVDFAAMRGILRVVSPLALEPRVPIERRYVFAGLGDRLAPPAQVRNFWRHWGRPRIVWYPGGHLSFRFEPAVQALVTEALAAGGLVREVSKR